MKLTTTLVAAIATVLYLIIKQAAPEFPIDQSLFYEFLLWVISYLLGLAVEPGLRSRLVNFGLKGFRPTNKDH